MSKGSIRRRIAIVMVLAMVASIGVAVPPVSAAAGTFTGGAWEMPLYMANDHTPIAIRINSTAGLEASTSYYVKVRFTTATTPDSATNRGWTWNWTTNTWAQERDAWTSFPIITTSVDGSIPDTWVYTKFGDEDESGTYYAMVSLSKTGASSTYNSSLLPQVTVLDMASDGGWVHNGTATSVVAAKRAEITATSPTTTVYSLSKTEADVVDTDANGTIDDEDFGPAGVTGDVRFAVPLSMPFNVYLNRNYSTGYAVSQSVTVTDTDLALKAADLDAPAAPSNLTATAGSNSVELAWNAATDGGGSGIAAYRVYRWLTSPSTAYTFPKALVGTTAAGTTSFVDTGLTKGVEYSYEIRAVDASTNVGPRSATETCTPLGLMETDRTYGADRYSTAIAISSANFPDSSVTTAVVATGKAFPDALSASALAGVYGSPILLVRDSVTASLTAELDRLGVQDVVIVGGESAVPAGIATALAADYGVSRVQGSDRYATSAAIASRVESLTGDVNRAFFARGDSFADALAVSPFAYNRTVPVLLVRPTAVPPVTAAAIATLGITDGVIAGSESAVAAGVKTDLEGMVSGAVVRVGGTDRYATARAVADYGVAQGWGDYSYVGLATGTNYPDALGGGPVAGMRSGVLLLTRPDVLSPVVASAITANKATIDLVDIYGSTSAVSDAVRAAVEALLQ